MENRQRPADGSAPEFTVGGAAGIWIRRVGWPSITLLIIRLYRKITAIVLLLRC